VIIPIPLIIPENGIAIGGDRYLQKIKYLGRKMVFLKRGLISGLLAALVFSLRVFPAIYYSKYYELMYTWFFITKPIAGIFAILMVFGMPVALIWPGLCWLYPKIPWDRVAIITIVGGCICFVLSTGLFGFGMEIFGSSPQLLGQPYFIDTGYSVDAPPPAWPDFRFYGTDILLGILINLYLGLMFISGVKGRWLAKLLGPILGTIVLVFFVFVIQRLCPPERLVIMQYWEGITIVLGIPLLCGVSWGMLDINFVAANRE